MDADRSFYQLEIEDEKQIKWFHRRPIKIIFISLIALIILVIILSLLLEFVIVTPKNITTTAIMTSTTTQGPSKS
jgi:hypothetical protein